MNSIKKVLMMTAGAAFCFAAMADQTTAAEKDWTVLVFLNGNNSLDSFGPGDINEMENVGSTDKINVVVQWASESTRHTKRMLVKKDTNANTVTSPVLQDMGLVDMGNVDELVKFAEWGIKAYPAKHYLIDIWNHGNGWQKNTTHGTSTVFKDLSYDDISGNHITTEQLGTGMAQIKTFLGRNVDILGFDACLMAMAEVGGEIAESTDFLVGSEDLEPGDGWAYDDFLKLITSGTDSKDVKTVASALVTSYVSSYTNGSQGTETVHLAAQDMKALRDMYPALANLATSINQIAASNPAGLNAAIGATLGFYGSDYKDLGSFLTQLQTKSIGIDANTIEAVRTQMKNVVTFTQGTDTLAAAQGLSLWIPSDTYSWSEYGTRYKGFIFDQETHWSKWIETLAGASAPSQQ